MSELGKYGHHPDPLTDAEVEIDRLQGLLVEAQSGLVRALDYRAATPEGLAIKGDIRDALRRVGCYGNLGLRTEF
jgi:hypothetical protein